MNAENTPLGMPEIRRLNKVPLAVVAVVLLLVVSLVFLAMFRRGQEAIVQDAEDEIREKVSSQGPNSIGDLIGSDTKSGIIGQRIVASERPVFGADNTEDLPRKNWETDSRVPLGDEGRERARKFRDNLFYEAVVASSVVSTDGITKPPVDTDLAPQITVSNRITEDKDPNLRGRKEQFATTERRYGYNPERITEPVNPYVLRVGTVIPAVMLSGINSDLPGMISAQVSLNVRDTATGRHLLIPQGARLVGAYDSHIAMGQRRVLVAWHRLQYPDASVIELGNMPGADVGGYAGFSADVDNHYFRIFGNAFLLSMISAGTAMALPDSDGDDDLSPREEAAEEITMQWARLGQKLIEKNLNIQPTLMVEPGYQFSVVVNKDLILEPYGKS